MSELQYFKTFETEEGPIDVSVPRVPSSLESVRFALPKSGKKVHGSGDGAWHGATHLVKDPVPGTITRSGGQS